jgi:hypothetical protein
MRRLTEIRDVVTNLVASETARGSLEEEVAKSVATGVAAGAAPSQAPASRTTAEGARHALGAQLPGRGGRDAAAEPTRTTPARTPRTADTQEEPPGRTGTTASDSAPAKPAPRSTGAGGGAHASGARQNGSTD